MSLREDNKIRTRAAILRTARHMFRERGYADTMVGDIADEVLISRQTLYNYFPTKDSLLLGIFDEEMYNLEAIAQSTDEKKRLSPVARIRSFIETYIMDSFEYLGLTRHIAFRVVTNSSEETDSHSPGSEQLAPLAHARLHASIAELIREAKAAGEIRTDVPTRCAVDMLLGCYYAVIFEASSLEALSEDEARVRTKCLLDIALRGLGPGSSPG